MTTDRAEPAPAARMKPSAGENAAGSRRDLSTLARGWLLNLVGIISSGLFGFLFGIVVARGLGASGAGIFFTAVALFTIAAAAA